MPQCKNCHRDISRLYDKDVCPYCGEEHPIEDPKATLDITKVNLKALSGGEYELPPSKTRLKAGLLCLFLGIFGAHDFYLGFIKKAFLELSASLILIGGLGSLLFFTGALGNALAFLIPFAACFLAFAAMSVYYFKNASAKDAKGELLR